MSYRVDRSRQFGSLGDSPTMNFRRNEPQRKLVDEITAEPPRDVDATIITRRERVYDSPLAVSLGKRAVETTRQALEAIEAARTEQLRLATEAAAMAETGRSITLNVQSATQETEITRIKGAALKPNGEALIGTSDVSISIDDLSAGTSYTYVLGASKQFSDSSGTSLTAPTPAATAKTTFEQGLDGLRSFLAGIGAIEGSISSTIKPPDGEKIAAEAEREAEQNEPRIDPAAFAEVIAERIGDPFLADTTRQQIIETSAVNLDPEKVKRLLSDDEPV